MSGDACYQTDVAVAYALQSLPAADAVPFEAHLAHCRLCQQEVEALQSTLDAFVAWPTDVLRPPHSLQDRLARRIAEESGQEPLAPPAPQWSEPDWERVAPGIDCKILAKDSQRHRVSMLVKLAPGAAYPPHTHAGVEELHLLDGELWIDERKLHPGDYNRGEPGAGDKLVWSETGCTCILITSTDDVLT